MVSKRCQAGVSAEQSCQRGTWPVAAQKTQARVVSEWCQSRVRPVSEWSKCSSGCMQCSSEIDSLQHCQHASHREQAAHRQRAAQGERQQPHTQKCRSEGSRSSAPRSRTPKVRTGWSEQLANARWGIMLAQSMLRSVKAWDRNPLPASGECPVPPSSDKAWDRFPLLASGECPVPPSSSTALAIAAGPVVELGDGAVR